MQEMTLNVPDELLTTLIKQQINKKQTELTEINWDTKTAAKRTGIKEDRVKAIFRNQKWKHELDAENGGSVLYPYQGQGYQINPKRFTEFCDKHWFEIMNLNPRKR
ncbi:MAG: DUF771 domain-containing protein [Companilactobacillus sp.]|jgi:phage pi2 protein 07|uniref:DUF771 domain-containing protein n=1 Tax=Companilactobacillus ginsenosidimutans TaxID=1007676 RepID=A0A0H4QES2_9LACO|nr:MULTISPECIES: DUF771 domain-containing protein [Companilactobacillus]AKP66884.1 hypothetical protein ABM34_04485 [Companilactobacillus ginsenosidimutans]MCH4010341.1 DUF771 domain-containing protein [Companilactobacillus sp.]MCH4051983.1 DUF771 domain-containing protein [Companilactobacillus sp.]MCH4075781.1 DUF771 domain-containing protein [Companilactobacillus sp.]MCH4126859.1 DUF771 domain-containing protein [Companilactobacillus sp.]